MPLTFGNGNMCGRVGVVQQKPHGRMINRNAAQSGRKLFFSKCRKIALPAPFSGGASFMPNSKTRHIADRDAIGARDGPRWGALSGYYTGCYAHHRTSRFSGKFQQ